jgi:hypothetical protein
MLRLLLVAILGASCLASPAPAAVTPSVSPSATDSPQQTARSEPPHGVNETPRLSPSPTATPSATPEPAVAPCRAWQLEARASGQGATGSILGAIFFVNRGSSLCGLRGHPAAQLLDASGAILDVRVGAAKGEERLVVLRPSGFGDWTPLTSPPVESAYVMYQWFNWCGARGAVAFRVYLPNGQGTLDAPFISHGGAVVDAPGAKPRCDSPDASSGASSMGVGPFSFSGDLR